MISKLICLLGLNEKVIADLKTKKKAAERLKFVLTESKIESCDKEVGHLLFLIAEKLNPAYNHRLPLLFKYVLSKKITSPHQLDAAVEYIKEKGELPISDEEFEKRVGVGIEITEEDIKKEILVGIQKHSTAIKKERYKYAYINILYEVKKNFAYLDSKLAKKILEEEFDKFLGGKNKEEIEEDNLRNEQEELKKKSKDKKAFSEVDAKRLEEVKTKLKIIDEAHKKNKEVEEEKPEKDKLASLMARDMKSAMNPPHVLQKHIEFTKGKVFTRFPPEPNGFLHIGHAKAMRFSFTSAENNGGFCYLRYDDTNPEKETKEFIINIEENVRFLGYKPWKITYASEYFEDLYQLARELIKKGKAFVCHQTKQEMNEYRDKKMDSPFRNRSVEENLKLFEMMRQGRFEEKECCLRMKIDMKHNNPCMRDPVAYRIKYVPHPHAGNKWCIYPTYDYTHCLNDSLENVTHSLCTLEFEIRRDSYYWLLEALDLYRPFVWEYSRLNLSRNVLSKRKLTQLVVGKYVRGWDDPRLLTINGLRRKGYEYLTD
jgi:glutaminyl-tRNA synthetase